MEVVILAGGFGTRLHQVVSDVPKPMAPIDEKGTPFLRIILDDLKKFGTSHIVLAVGYMHEVISNYFGDEYKGMRITYSVEEKPLLTGGAIKKALDNCHDKYVIVLNGDTYFQVDYKMLCDCCKKNNADVVIALKEMHNFNRYGAVETIGKNIIKFKEKCFCSKGMINGGVYCIDKSLLIHEHEKFSFEDFLSINKQQKKILGIEMDGIFVDIGVPDDYFKAKRMFGLYEV